MVRKLILYIILLGCGVSTTVKFLVLNSPERRLAQHTKTQMEENPEEFFLSSPDVQQALGDFYRREIVFQNIETYLNPITAKISQLTEPFISSLSFYLSISHFFATFVFYFFIFFSIFSLFFFLRRKAKKSE